MGVEAFLELACSLFFGGGEPASQLVGPSATGYNESLEPYPYDIDRARQLVEEAAALCRPRLGEASRVSLEVVHDGPVRAQVSLTAVARPMLPSPTSRIRCWLSRR